MIVEVCPKCGSDLNHVVLTTYPPIHKYTCKCGWFYELRDNIEKVPFQEKHIGRQDSMDNFFAQQGWVCPKCGRVMSPNTPICLYCNKDNTTTATINTADSFNVDYVHKDTITFPNTGDGNIYEHLTK